MLTRSKKPAVYRLSDMADDAAGLLRELNLAPAHVIGASMGGMIAQTLAARHPDSVLSLTSIMSMTGSRWKGQPSPLLYPMFLRRPAEGREQSIERTMKVRLERREDELKRGRYRDKLTIPVWRDVLWRRIAERTAPVSGPSTALPW